MKFSAWLTLFVLISAITSLSGCRKQPDEKLSLRIHNGMESAILQKKPFVLRFYSDFAWDTFYLFGPYTSREKLSAAIGINADRLDTDIENIDRYVLALFFYQGKLVRFTHLNRYFPTLKEPLKLNPAQAVWHWDGKFFILSSQQEKLP